MEPLPHSLPPFLLNTSPCTVRGHMPRSGQLSSCIQAPLTPFLPPLTTQSTMFWPPGPRVVTRGGPPRKRDD